MTGASNAQVKPWLNADLSMAYSYDTNDQSFKGDGGPLIGLLIWPQTDNAKDWLSPAGTRRRLTTISAGSEYDNPYFMVEKNHIDSKNNRLLTNLGLTVTPVSWGYLKTNIGVDIAKRKVVLRGPPHSSASRGS